VRLFSSFILSLLFFGRRGLGTRNGGSSFLGHFFARRPPLSLLLLLLLLQRHTF